MHLEGLRNLVTVVSDRFTLTPHSYTVLIVADV